MSKRIEKLTPEQIARMPEWVAKWTAIGLSTEPADWETAERGVRGCYAAAKLPQPKVILRMGSPFAATVGGAMAVALLEGAEKQGTAQHVREHVEGPLVRQAWEHITKRVVDQVRAQVRAEVPETADGVVRWSLEEQVRPQLGNLWHQYRGAQLWASWYAYVSFLRDVCGWENPTLEAFAHDEAIAKSAGWTWWRGDVCAISDRPRVLKRDARGRLHCEDGPAIAYPDGWSIYAWHGARVGEAAIMTPPEKISLDMVLAERNTEVSRVLMLRAGPGLWNDQRVEHINRDVDGAGQPRELLRVKMPTGEPVAIVRVQCPSTGGEYRLHVPPTTRTCREGVAWTFRLGADEYAPTIET